MEEQVSVKPPKPSKNRTLTKARRRKIIEACLDGKDIKQAAIAEGYSPRTAASQARQILANPNAQRSFVRILDEQGLTDDFLAAKARELLNSSTPHFFSKDGIVCDERYTPAHETQRKTLELVSKFKGHLKESSSADVSIGLMQMVVNVVNEPERKD